MTHLHRLHNPAVAAGRKVSHEYSRRAPSHNLRLLLHYNIPLSPSIAPFLILFCFSLSFPSFPPFPSFFPSSAFFFPLFSSYDGQARWKCSLRTLIINLILWRIFNPCFRPMDVGTRVVRGPDWKWGNQDDGEGHVGTVVEIGKVIIHLLLFVFMVNSPLYLT